MLKHRVIPTLLLRNNGLVKTLKFKDQKYVGDPINAIRIFNDKEVDELMVLDIMASKKNSEPNYSLIEEFAGECFMPLAYGGGVRTIDQASRIFGLGVEKICLQSAALTDLSLVTRLAERFGSQSVVVSVDVKRNWRGKPQLYAAAKQKNIAMLWLEFAKRAAEVGAGEILLNSVHYDGTMQGPDLELIRQASSALSVPLIATGGFGSLADIKAAVNVGASAVAAGAFLCSMDRIERF